MEFDSLEGYLDYLVDWLREMKKRTFIRGFIVGLSGGIDSAVVAALLKKAVGDDCLAVAMPCHSNTRDLEDAKLVADAISIKFEIVDLSSAFDTVSKMMKLPNIELSKGALQNTKARLRMTTLYALGQSLGYLVVGTDNADEWYTGYFTKFGDGGVDLAPILNLTKGQVRKAAKILGIPESIITKAPTAGLTADAISDEEDLGVSYPDLDLYLLGDNSALTGFQAAAIEKFHRLSEHKRHMAVRPEVLFNKNLRE